MQVHKYFLKWHGFWTKSLVLLSLIHHHAVAAFPLSSIFRCSTINTFLTLLFGKFNNYITSSAPEVTTLQLYRNVRIIIIIIIIISSVLHFTHFSIQSVSFFNLIDDRKTMQCKTIFCWCGLNWSEFLCPQ